MVFKIKDFIAGLFLILACVSLVILASQFYNTKVFTKHVSNKVISIVNNDVPCEVRSYIVDDTIWIFIEPKY
jgi:hypothetical protein